MGYDAACTLTYEGKATRGTAWLEHKELVFRGPNRLAIPLASVTSATARDGVLTVRFAGRTAALAIGAAAEKWAARITNPPSRIDKLGVKAGMTVAILSIGDSAFVGEVEQRGATVLRSTPPRAVDAIFYAANHRDALSKLGALVKLLQPNGALWVVRPKGRPEITEADSMAAGKHAGLVDVKVVSFSDTHTAEKYVIPVATRKLAARSAEVGSARMLRAKPGKAKQGKMMTPLTRTADDRRK
jgi:hypothetical protein